MKLRHFDDDPQQEIFRKIFANIEDLYERLFRVDNVETKLIVSEHARLHDIDSTADHNGVTGATTDNIMVFDSNGLPKDSGLAVSGGTTEDDIRFAFMLAAE